MTNKECFIYFVKELKNTSLFNIEDYSGAQREIFEKALEYFDSNIVNGKQSQSVDITEKGLKILEFMQQKESLYNNCFKAKIIGEGLFCSGRAVAGAMIKLVNDGYCEKKGKDPVIYALTDLGRNKEIKVEN